MKFPILILFVVASYAGTIFASEPIVQLHSCPPVVFNFSKNEQQQEDPFTDPINISNKGWLVSPRVANRLPGLSDEVYDIGEYLAHSGIVTENALQLRDLELMAIVATPEMQEEAAIYVEGIRWGRAMILEFSVTLSLEGEPPLAKVSFPARSGQRIKLETVGLDSTTMTLDFDPTIGPAANTLDLNFVVNAEVDSNPYSLSSTTTLAFETPQKIVLGMVGEPAKDLALSVVAVFRPLVPKPVVPEVVKNEIIEKVKALKGSLRSR